MNKDQSEIQCAVSERIASLIEQIGAGELSLNEVNKELQDIVGLIEEAQNGKKSI